MVDGGLFGISVAVVCLAAYLLGYGIGRASAHIEHLKYHIWETNRWRNRD